MKSWSHVQNSVRGANQFATSISYPNNETKGLPQTNQNSSFESPRKQSNHFASYFNFKEPTTYETPAINKPAIEDENTKEKDNSDDKPENVKELMKAFCTETSAHGLPHLVKGSGWNLLRVVWLVIFACAMIGECLHLILLIQQYLQFPSMDSFRVSDSEPEFPAITVCNSDPFSDVGYWFRDFETPSFDHYYYWAGDAPVDDGYVFWNRVNSAKGVFENVNRTELRLLGHQLQDLIMYCSYRGIECHYDNHFQHVESPTFYNCYTYNVPKTPVDVGPDKGLTLILFLEGNPNSNMREKLFTRDSNVEQTFGARIQIHEKGTLPNPVLSGIHILPGHSTSLSLKQSTRRKLGDPFSSCEHRKHLADLGKYRYSTKGCYDICKVQYVYNQCGCVNSDTPVPDSLRELDVRFCGTYNETHFNTTNGYDEWMENVFCEKDALLSFTTKICEKAGYHPCNEACVYSAYEVSLSQSIWPSIVALRDAYIDFVEGDKAEYILRDAFINSSHTSSREELRDLMWYNIARVNIYFNEARVIDISEMQSMSLYDLFAGIGGTIGLWAGLSVITVLEFVSLPIQLLQLYFHKSKLKSKTSKNQVTPFN